MLIQFTVGNYRSFKEKQTLSMLATRVEGPEECVRDEGKYRLLTSAAIYGANASGKSNLIQAMVFMISFILSSSTSFTIGNTIPIEPFLLTIDNDGMPSHFEIIFVCQHKLFRYGFEADKRTIIKEWLYHTPNTREALLFERDNGKIILRSSLKREKNIFEKTRSNSLFLSVLAQFNNQLAKDIASYFHSFSYMTEMNDIRLLFMVLAALQNESRVDKTIEFLKDYDTHINDLLIEDKIISDKDIPPIFTDEFKKNLLNSPRPEIQSIHNKYDSSGNVSGKVTFSFDKNESMGTQKLLTMANPILLTLENGGKIIIDEMEARLHPIITESIVRLFQQRRTNPNGAQLIFATHDTNLLSANLLRRDQVWFAEKNRVEATNLYSLVEYKPRKQENYERNYIQGRYGAIPFVGGIERLAEIRDEE